MTHRITEVLNPSEEPVYIYVNGTLEMNNRRNGMLDPWRGSDWLALIQKYQHFAADIVTIQLTQEAYEKYRGNDNLVPNDISGFLEGEWISYVSVHFH